MPRVIRFSRPDPPTDPAFEPLFGVFPDFAPHVVDQHAAAWDVRLDWPADQSHFVDPAVPDTARDLFGIAINEIGPYRRDHTVGRAHVVVSLVHAWALLAAAAGIRALGRPFEWVVHVDDHTDLMPVLLRPGAVPGEFGDAFDGARLDVTDPASVVSAVERGTVHKGNFLTAYLLANPSSRVVHVRAGAADRERLLRYGEGGGVLLGRPYRESSLTLEEAVDVGSWTETPAVPLTLPSRGPVWLDVDLDFFCNRLDGDSDRLAVLPPEDEATEVEGRLSAFSERLLAAEWLPDVVAVSVAVSPGFFPAEYWAGALRTVMDAIESGLVHSSEGRR